MRNIFIIVLTIYSLTLKCQNFGNMYCGIYTFKEAQRDLDKQIEKGIKKRSSSYSKSAIGDTLIYNIQDSVDGFRLRLTFNFFDSILDKKLCDFQEYTFDCTPCSQKHLSSYLSGDYYGFRKTSETTYLSKYFWSIELDVKYKTENKDCLIISFKKINRPKKEYKEYYNTLPKK